MKTRTAQPYTKISAPHNGISYKRQRLFDMLDSFNHQQIIWVCGPPGCGKTSLVSSYYDGKLAIWYRIDKNDNDIGSIFFFLSQAAATFDPDAAVRLPLFTPEYALGLKTFARNFFVQFFASVGHKPISLIFDNCQELTGGSALMEVFEMATSLMNPNSQIVLISRNEPPTWLSRFWMNGDMAYLGWDQMKLKDEEVSAIAELKLKRQISSQEVQALQSRVDGWVAGLVIMLENYSQGALNASIEKTDATHTLFDLLAEELLGKLGNDESNTLCIISLLPWFNHAMVDALGSSDDHKTLVRLQKRNYFLFETSEHHDLFAFHPIFREFLLERFHQRFSAQEILDLCAKSGRVMAENGYDDEAMPLLHQGKDWLSINRLVIARAQMMIRQGRHETLAEWLGALPEVAATAFPCLNFWRGQALLPTKPLLSISLFRKTHVAFRRSNNDVGVVRSLAGLADAIFFAANCFSDFDFVIELTSEYNFHNSGFPDQQTKEQVVPSIFLAFALRNPSHPNFTFWRNQVREVFEHGKDPFQRLLAAQNLLTYLYWSGEFIEQAMVIELTRSLAEGEAVPPLAKVMVLMGETYHAWLTAEFDVSAVLLRSYASLSQDSGIHLWDSHFEAAATADAIGRSDLGAAKQHLSRMAEGLPVNRRLDTAIYLMMRLWYALEIGSMQEARIHSKAHLVLAEAIGATLPTAVSVYSEALLHHLSGEEAEAADRLSQAFALSKHMESAMLLFMCHGLEAEIALDSGDDKAAELAINRTLAIGAAKGIYNHFVCRSQWLSRLCAEAFKRGIETEYATRLVLKRGLLPCDSISSLEAWPWHLRFYTMGRFEVWRDNVQLTFDGKAPSRPLEILELLLAQGDRGAHKDRVVDTLWPDAEGDAASSAFSTNLRRLRRLLGTNKALLLSDGILRLNPKYCWVDTRAFTTHMSEGRIKEALDLYHGPFLYASCAYWSIPLREQLALHFVRGGVLLAERLIEAGDRLGAIEILENALETDAFAEPLYYQLMKLYCEHGSTNQAAFLYERYLRKISASNVAPTPRLRRLYQGIEST